MPSVCVFTPTYNRAHTLKKLYISLISQTDLDFVWYIVDGDSNDNTKELVNAFIKENLIKIKFEQNSRKSKYTSLIYYGIPNNTSKLLFIVDSDDYIANDAIEKIKINDNLYDGDDIAGYFYLCTYYQSNIPIKPLVNGEKIHGLDLGIKRKDKVDTCCQVYKNNILKKYQFPDFEEEFMPESVIWNKVDKDYYIVTINESIYFREYQNDGYTKDGKAKNVRSPHSSMESKRYLISGKNIPFRLKIKSNILYIVYGLFAGYKLNEILKKDNNKLLVILCFPIAYFIRLYWIKYE